MKNVKRIVCSILTLLILLPAISVILVQAAPAKVDLTNAQRQALNAFFSFFAGDNYDNVWLADYDVTDSTQSTDAALSFVVFTEVRRGLWAGSPPNHGTVIREDRGGIHFDFVTASYIETLLVRFFGITDIQHRDIYLGEWRAIEFRNGRYYHVSVNGGPGIERELNIIDFYDNGNGTFSAGIEIEIREFNEGELTDQRQHFNTAIIRPFGDTWQLLYWQNDANRNAPLPGYQPSSLAPVTAAPTQAPVLVNGQNVAFQAYHIDGSNFFRLRDIAYVLNGTSAQFNVEWDAANSAILLQTRTPYTPVGGEMAGAAAGSVAATPTQAAVYLDGEPINLRAYHIDGNNFFMLRDLGEALGFDVDWDSQARAVLINTD